MAKVPEREYSQGYIISNAADRLVTDLGQRFEDELIRVARCDGNELDVDMIWEAFHSVMCSRPDWATKTAS